MGKRESPQSEWDTGVSDPGAFKLDHLQPVKLILFQRMSTFLPFILGAPISYYPRERKKGRIRGWKWGKGNHPKVNETEGFLTLEHSNWTICSLLIWFCSKEFPPFYQASHNNPFLIIPERGSKEAAGAENGKVNSPKVNDTKGCVTSGHSNWTICSLWNQFYFVPKKCPP